MRPQESQYPFLKPLLFLGMVAGLVLSLMLFTLSPFDETSQPDTPRIALFLFVLFLTLYSFIAVGIFFARNLFSHPFEKKALFKSCQRWGFLASLAIVGLAILSLLGVLNILTAILLLTVLITLEGALR